MNNNPNSENDELEINKLLFEEELQLEKFPFYKLILQNEGVKDEVFKTFLSTPLVPSITLFMRDRFDENEIQEGINEVNRKMPVTKSKDKVVMAYFVEQTNYEKKLRKVNAEFYDLIIGGELDKKYYGFSFNNTSLHKSLKHIEESFTDFEKKVLTKRDCDPKDYAEVFAQDVITKLEKIGSPKLTKAILTEFVEKLKPIQIEIEPFVCRMRGYEFSKKYGFSFEEAKRKYRELKRYADNYFNEYLESIDSTLYNTKKDGHKPKAKKTPQPTNFDEMFVYPYLIQDCIDVLKEVEPAVLNQTGNYIGKYKSSFCVWVDKLKRKGLIKHYSDRSIYATLISQRFSPFTINESTFGKSNAKANELYQVEFEILLSQVSQKVK